MIAVLEKLPIGAAAGASGWTYAVMKVLFLRNGDYSDRASLLLATFCNLMLSGKLRSQVSKSGSELSPSVSPRRTGAPFRSVSATPGTASSGVSPSPRLAIE